METQLSSSLVGMMVPSSLLQHVPSHPFFRCSCVGEMPSLPPVLRELSSPVVFPRGPVKLVLVLDDYTAGEPLVVYPGVCSHEIPLSMSPVMQATGWRIVLT